LKSFNLLVENGISEELAFMECFLELKSISAALVNLGPEEFFKLISPNALMGSEKGRELILNHHFDNALEKILNDIKHNQFYREAEKDYHPTRDMVINRWKHERLNRTYKKLKKELIDQ
jgi:ketol-acid reductoisomerase